MIVNKYKYGGGGGEFDPTKYYTKQQTDAQISGATEGLASEDYVDDAIEEAISGITLDDYWTSGETKSYVDDQISAVTDMMEAKEEVVASALTELNETFDDYYTMDEVDAAIEDALSGISFDGYWTSGETKSYVDEQVSWVTEYIEDVERVTATALTELHNQVVELSGATEDFATEEYVDNAIEEALTGVSFDNYWTSGETKYYVDAAITSATQDFVTEEELTGYTSMQDFEDFQDAISVKEEVIASAITELHTDVLALSAATPDMSDYYTSAQTEDAISAATAGKADAANVTPNDFMRFPKWNEQGVITGTTGNNLSTTGFYLNGTRRNLIKEATSGDLGDAYAPITPGTAGQILVSSGNGAPVWATDNKVDSQDVKHIVKLTQAEYDALTVKDPNTFYIIVSQ